MSPFLHCLNYGVRVVLFYSLYNDMWREIYSPLDEFDKNIPS